MKHYTRQHHVCIYTIGHSRFQRQMMSQMPKHQGPQVFNDFLDVYVKSRQADKWLGDSALCGLYKRFTQAIQTIVHVDCNEGNDKYTKCDAPPVSDMDWGTLMVTLGHHIRDNKSAALQIVNGLECQKMFESWNWVSTFVHLVLLVVSWVT